MSEMGDMKFTKDEKVMVTYEGEDYDAKYFSAIDENRSFVLIYEKPVKAENPKLGMQVNVRCVKVSNDAIKPREKDIENAILKVVEESFPNHYDAVVPKIKVWIDHKKGVMVSNVGFVLSEATLGEKE